MADRERLGKILLALAPAGVFLVALILCWVYSSRTGPAFDELNLLASIERDSALVRRIASHGFGELFLPATRSEIASPALLVLAGSWAKLVLPRLGIADALTAARMPWLVLGALAPAALYVALRPSRGVVTALLAALALGAMPRWLHAVVVQREAAAVAAAWWIVIALYVRSLGPARTGAPPSERRTLLFAVLGALALGLGLAISLATLWLVPLLLAHFVFIRLPLARRSLRRGRVPISALVLFALPLAPALWLGLSPNLWGASPAQIAGFMLSPLAPSIAPTLYAGKVASAAPVPSGYSASFVVFTSSLSLLLAALVGFFTLAYEALARRFATGKFRPARDRHRVGSLAAMALFAVLFGAVLTPKVLTTFPPRSELALPALAVLAAIGVLRLAHGVSEERRRAVAIGAFAFAFAFQAFVAPGKASLAFSPALGGARSIRATELFGLGDGSELALFAPAFDRAGTDPVRVDAPRDVPAQFFDVLHEARRLRSAVIVAPGGMRLVRGAPPTGAASAEVRRDGVVVWSVQAR